MCGNPLMSANHVFWEQEGVIHTCPQCAPFSFGYTGTDVYQIQALLDLYNATNGPHWYNSDGWPAHGLLASCSDKTQVPCNGSVVQSPWNGIFCSGTQITCVHFLERIRGGGVYRGADATCVGAVRVVTRFRWHDNRCCTMDSYLGRPDDHMQGTLPDSLSLLTDLM